MSVANINGQRIHFTDTGSSPQTLNHRTAAVFSHGALLDSSIWRGQLEALAPTHRGVAWDARLHGATVDDGKDHTAWDSARDLLGLLDSLDVDRAVLVGHSQGGFVALRAALLDPARVSGLVLLDTMAAAWPQEALTKLSGAAAGFAA